MPDTAPVTPADFTPPTPTMDECEGLSLAIFQIPAKVWQLINWMMDSSGVVTRAFAKWVGILKPGDIIMSCAPLAEDSTRLLANGQTVSRETYADLFAAIGTVYGAGDGSTTFQLPDFRDRVPRAVGTDVTLGEQSGADTVTLTPAQLPAAGGVFGVGSITGVILAVSAGGTFDATAVGSTHRSAAWQGAGDAVNIEPKFQGTYFYVRT